MAPLDDGRFIDRCELTDVLYELDRAIPKPYGRPLKKAGAPDLPRLTVLYIHGWKHSGSAYDPDREEFTKLVGALQKSYEKEKQVLGVYVSWNASTGVTPLDYFSFWPKQAVADRIAQSGVVTRILTAIGALRRPDPPAPDQFIAIGHSFGARILFTATNHPLLAEAARAHPNSASVPAVRARPTSAEYRPMSGAADSIVLLNPAFEASMYTALDGLCRTRDKETYPAGQPPLLISISTKNDSATKLYYPLGQYAGLHFRREVVTTLGNHEPYRTHTLYRANPEECLAAFHGRPPPFSEAFAAQGICLKRDPPTKGHDPHCPHNPFLVARTTRDIIDNHNGIWTPHFREWLFALVKELEANHRERLKE